MKNSATTHSNSKTVNLSVENLQAAINQLEVIVEKDIPIRIRASIDYRDWRAIYGKNSIED